jgi:hypothetical protein
MGGVERLTPGDRRIVPKLTARCGVGRAESHICRGMLCGVMRQHICGTGGPRQGIGTTLCGEIIDRSERRRVAAFALFR